MFYEENMKKISINYKKLAKILLILLIFFLVSVLSTVILSLIGIVSFEGGEIKLNQALFDSFKNSWYGCLFTILLQVIITSLLSFVPGVSMAFIMLVQSLYQNPPLAFLISFSAVLLSSLMMYLLGRFGGYALCTKLLGKEDCDKASDLLNNKGTIFFPLMMLFPMFPDDALVMMAGTLKMSLKWFIPSIVVCRGIGVASIIFGLGSIPFDKFTTPWHWIGFIAACAIGIFLVFFAAAKLNKYMQKNNAKSDEKLEEVVEEDIEEKVEETN